MIIDSARNHRIDTQFYVPNIAVAETFTAFDRACYSKWDNKTGKKFGGKGKTLDTRRFKTARDSFRRDIHNGALFYQYDLSRYHILALDLVSPIDKHRKFYRTNNVMSMGASDLLIGGMAIHLSKLLGKENFCLISTDRRMNAIFCKAPYKLKENTITKLELDKAAKELGFHEWTPNIYPNVLDPARCSEQELKKVFGHWPLETRKKTNIKPKA
jgi:hypothetical protein